MRHGIAFCVFLTAMFACAGAASAAQYYVDFEDGADTNGGTTPGAAFKHCPGDPQAADKAKGTELRPGDTVILKGGVVYRGTITVTSSGEEGRPITYDGNTRDEFGRGRAIVSGAEPLTGWTRCKSADEAAGNPNWKNIYTAYAPAGVKPMTANLCEADKLLWIAQDPPQPDPFYMDKIAHFHTIPGKNVTRTSLIDPERLNQADEHYWDGATVLVWCSPNVVRKRSIDRFIPAENKIVFGRIGEPYSERDERYSIINHVSLIRRPGAYVVSVKPEPDGRSKVWLWPLGGGNPNDAQITVSVRTNGFDIVGGGSYLTFQGFHIRRFSSDVHREGIAIRAADLEQEKTGLVARNNLITHVRHSGRGYGGVYIYKGRDCLIEDNRIREMPLSMGILCGDCHNTTTRGNVVRKAGAQSIWYMGCIDSKLIGNEVYEGQGTHANGISVYQGSRNVLVFGNKVFESNLPFTFNDSEHLTIACNIFHGTGSKGTISWGRVNHARIVNNVLIGEVANLGLAIYSPKGKDFVIKNNILSGFNAEEGWDVSHNLHLGTIFRSVKLRPTEMMERDRDKVFVNAAEHDYRLRPGSPAIDSGVDVGLEQDILGTPIPQGKAPDMGAYEHKAE